MREKDRFAKYVVFGLLTHGGVNTREMANDLAKEWEGLVYVRADIADQIEKDRDELSATIEACHDLLDLVDPEYVEGTTSLVPLDMRLKEKLDL